jgi:hypothetical protein
MKDVQMTVEEEKLTITVNRAVFPDADDPRLLSIASTEGSVSVPDREQKVGLNVYRKK